MKLTGKAKEQFEEWLNTQKGWKDNWYGGVLLFEGMPNQMQWGVFQDWADSLGYDIYYSPYYDWTKEKDTGFKWYSSKRKDSYISHTGLSDTIQEARNAAIEKLNEIINQA
jgi:hypothetical protein